MPHGRAARAERGAADATMMARILRRFSRLSLMTAIIDKYKSRRALLLHILTLRIAWDRIRFLDARQAWRAAPRSHFFQLILISRVDYFNTPEK